MLPMRLLQASPSNLAESIEALQPDAYVTLTQEVRAPLARVEHGWLSSILCRAQSAQQHILGGRREHS